MFSLFRVQKNSSIENYECKNKFHHEESTSLPNGKVDLSVFFYYSCKFFFLESIATKR